MADDGAGVNATTSSQRLARVGALEDCGKVYRGGVSVLHTAKTDDFVYAQLFWFSNAPRDATEISTNHEYLFDQLSLAGVGAKYINFQFQGGKKSRLPWPEFSVRCFPTLETARQAAHWRIDELTVEAEVRCMFEIADKLFALKQRIDDPSCVRTIEK